MKVLAMFPGQGSQYVGMGRELLDQFPYIKSTFEMASESAGFDVGRMCFDGPDSDLTLTANTQPCILTVSYAIWQVLKRECNLSPSLFAGHSLGEYSALVASNKLDFQRAVYLVRKRGQAMQTAVPVGVGSMGAVIGGDLTILKALCESASSELSSVEIANYNSPQQTVVAGHVDAVERLSKLLEEKGVRFVPLSVSAPFHSKLMAPARREMELLLSSSDLISNESKVIPNLLGELPSQYEISFLTRQIDSPVLWTQTMQCAESEDCNVFLEIGPGKVLAGLAKRSLSRSAKIVSINNVLDVIKEFSVH